MADILETTITDKRFSHIIRTTGKGTSVVRNYLLFLESIGLIEKKIERKVPRIRANRLSKNPKVYKRPWYKTTEKGLKWLQTWDMLQRLMHTNFETK